MRRINTLNPSLSGGEVVAQVIASHSTHIPSVHSMTLRVCPSVPNPSVGNTLFAPIEANKLIPTASPKSGPPTPGRVDSGGGNLSPLFTEQVQMGYRMTSVRTRRF